MPDAWTRWPDFKARMNRWRTVGVREFGNGACAIAPGRDLGLDGYMFWTFAPMSGEQVRAAEARAGVGFPAGLRNFYQVTNGARVFKAISICGSITAPRREPESPEPVDFYVGNLIRPEGAFIFGTISAWSVQLKLGIRPSGEVLLMDCEHVTDVLKVWPSFDAFLFAEMDRLEPCFDQNGHWAATYAELLPTEARHLEHDAHRRPS